MTNDELVFGSKGILCDGCGTMLWTLPTVAEYPAWRDSFVPYTHCKCEPNYLFRLEFRDAEDPRDRVQLLVYETGSHD